MDSEEYPVYQALDNDLTTTWAANDHVALFEFLPSRLTKISIALGYTKSNKVYRQNKRPGIIGYRLWQYSEEERKPLPVTDWMEVALSSPEVLPKAGKIFTEIPLAVNNVFISAIEIKVVKGIPEATTYDDVCISEIMFYGVPKDYDQGYSIVAESDDWIWPSATILGDSLEGNRLGYYFDSIDDKFSKFTHQWTGGASSTFQGISAAVKSGYHLKGKIITSDSVSVIEEEDFERTIQVRRINPFIALIDGHLFLRRQQLRNGKIH